MRTLICEICREPIAMFEPKKAANYLPINLLAFKPIYDGRDLPDPFPAGLGNDLWHLAKCPRCGRRPFFNHYGPRVDGSYIICTGEAVDSDGIWFLLVQAEENSIQRFEKLLLSDYRELAELPPEQPQVTDAVHILHDRYIGDDPQRLSELEQARQEPIELDADPTGNYKNSVPVACPYCGKQFRSKGRMEKYHQECPNKPPLAEGFRL